MQLGEIWVSFSLSWEGSSVLAVMLMYVPTPNETFLDIGSFIVVQSLCPSWRKSHDFEAVSQILCTKLIHSKMKKITPWGVGGIWSGKMVVKIPHQKECPSVFATTVKEIWSLQNAVLSPSIINTFPEFREYRGRGLVDPADLGMGCELIL